MHALLTLLACNGDALDSSPCAAVMLYLDQDDDGFGQDEVWAVACPDEGWSELPGDCDDGDPTQHPAGEGTCACTAFSVRVDWYEDLDGDGYGAGEAWSICQADPGWVREDGDCAPEDASIHPGAEESWYDGIDQDCDGADDYDADGDGWPLDEDCDDEEAAVHPQATELCDDALLDEDCDGLVNGDDPDAQGWRTWYLDEDVDGHGVADVELQACGPTEGYAPTADDCDDQQAGVSPSATEVCGTGLDEDCDGLGLECGVQGQEAWTEAGASYGGSTGAGHALASIDGSDGVRLLFGAPWEDSSRGALLSMEALLAEGGDLSHPDWSVEGGEQGHEFGAAVAVVGDQLAVSAPGATEGGGRGLVYLLEGDEGELAGTPVIAGRVGDQGAFGHLLAQLPDVDGDGLDELLVGDPTSGFTQNSGGEVSVYLGPLSSTDVYAAHATVAPDVAYQYLGYSCLTGADLDGDGVGEIVLGSPYTGSDGRLWVFDGAPGGRMELEDASSSLSGSAGQGLGQRCAAGDADGDGVDELLVGYSGGGHGALLLDGDLQELATLYGHDDRAGLNALALGADLDGDGQPDQFVGAPYSHLGSSYGGALFVHYGPASGSVDLETLDGVLGSSGSEQLGETLQVLPDLDGDGDPELLVGMPDRTGSELGGAVLVPGGPGI